MAANNPIARHKSTVQVQERGFNDQAGGQTRWSIRAANKCRRGKAKRKVKKGRSKNTYRQKKQDQNNRMLESLVYTLDNLAEK